MAEEETASATTIQPAAPSWVGNTQEIIKLLMQGQAQPAASGASSSGGQLNPWLKALEQATTPDTSTIMPVDASMQPAVPHKSELSAPAQPHKSAPVPSVQPVPVNQVPVSTVMQMQQHQLNPAVEAARQRMMQALMQRHTTPLRGQA